MKLIARRASSVKPKPIEWLWPGRIAKGKITVFCGNPGIGKGLVSCDLTAAVTRERKFPDAPNENQPMDVLMLFCEDGEADTVRPRLEAAGADLDRVGFLDSSIQPDKKAEKERFIALDKDIEMLRVLIKSNPNIGLVIVDPVSSYIGEASMDREQEVRRVLGPLARLAEELNIAVILVMHFNKRGDVSALHRVMGAVGMTGVARAVFLFAEDKDESGSFFFLCEKMNISKKPQGLKYRIEEKSLSVGPYPLIAWNGTTDISTDAALASKGDPNKLDAAKKWLTGFLTEDKPAPAVYSAALKAGIAEKTLKRAKKDLGIESEQTADGWIWLAPTHPATFEWPMQEVRP